ncbi:hypothetical protein [Streptomyces sp. NPDC018610]|jgi:hypothetical protein|uniref:hypothetical protein n=1 Tax=Streptomyces sp. NPDC018610 TaxID=3365049 RepID=UPI0037B6B656
MREKPDSGETSSAGEEVPKKRLELNAAQVAGSAVAAVVAAKLASYFGVYGTILGAGVVSVIATCGGSVFQHFFRRTGEQIRTVAVASRPGPADVPAGLRAAAPAERTAPPPGEFSPGTVHRARIRSWKRPLLGAALVFGVTMGGITVYETMSGDSFSGGHGTTVGDAVAGRHAGPSSGDDTPAPSTSSTDGPAAGDGTSGGTSPSGAASDRPGTGTAPGAVPTPDATASTGTGGTGSAGTGTDGTAGGGTATDGTGTGGSGTGGSGTADGTTGTDGGTTPAPGASATPPAPSADSRSGTAAADPAGPAAR